MCTWVRLAANLGESDVAAINSQGEGRVRAKSVSVLVSSGVVTGGCDSAVGSRTKASARGKPTTSSLHN